AYARVMVSWIIDWASRAKARMRDPLLYLIAGVTLIIGAVNVSTKLSDAADYGSTLPLSNPITTEYSSAAALILILPWLFAFFDKHPLSLQGWQRHIVPYFAASVAFSLMHVFLMVLMRKAAWPVLYDVPYDFFAGGYGEIIYEYRKDAITFMLYALIGELQRQIQLANIEKNKATDPITLKSGATTILIQPAEFLFAKSAGNYAEVTTTSGEHLARVTLTQLETKLKNKGCDAIRIHRSYIVNRATITETSPIAGGDFMLKLKNGETLRASRRYRAQLGD
ncbi:MAG: LytTR family DNA-binding domain-containing protein, partial [Kordiimonas sp.]